MRAEAAFLALLLAGCATAQTTPRTCRAEAAQDAIGTPAGLGVTEGIRRRVGARTVRVVRPGEMVTMDVRPDRVTITVDAQQRIARITCG